MQTVGLCTAGFIITAIPEVIDMLDLAGAIVTIGAMETQKEIAA